MSKFASTHARETTEVLTFGALGLKPHQARAFTQWLDDERPCGVSATLLVHLINCYVETQVGELCMKIDGMQMQLEDFIGPLYVRGIKGE